MFLRLSQVLSAAEVQELMGLAEKGRFVDGRKTAGRRVHGRKNVEQLEASADQTKRIDAIVLGAFRRHMEFQYFAMPRRALNVRLSRYGPGMEYGRHVDDAIIGDVNPMRSDLSITIFLSDPASYEGGELKLQTAYGIESIKLRSGDAVAYATLLPHWVEPVKHGDRIVAITWIESFIRDPLQRQILFDLKVANDKVWEKSPESEEADMLNNIHANLLRMWANS